MSDLAGKTLLMSGGSRGIGLAIAVRAARDGANVCFLAKTDRPHPKLAGTIHDAVGAVEASGGAGLAVVGDVRHEQDVRRAVAECAERFGGIDVVVNNASAIDLRPAAEIEIARYDLMQAVNCRGSFLLATTALPQLQASDNPHILTLSPPIDLDPRWAGAHLAYTISKYGMSMVTLGLAEELRPAGIAANSLWPRTLIATAAVQNLLGGDESMRRARTPEIVADAAHAMLVRPAREYSGNFAIDEDVLREDGVENLDRYLAAGATDDTLAADLFVAAPQG